jgi:hypothetical protein
MSKKKRRQIRPDALERVRKYLAAHKDTDGAGDALKYEGESTRDKKTRRNRPSDQVTRRQSGRNRRGNRLPNRAWSWARTSAGTWAKAVASGSDRRPARLSS